MMIPGRFRRLWRDRGITSKFTLTFSLLLGMIVLEGIASLVALNDVRRAENVILTSVEIRQRVFEMDGDLEKARRLHRDFFLQYPFIGFQEAQNLYFRPSTEIIAHVVSTSEELKRLIEGPHVSEPLRERMNDLTLYLNTARRFSDIFSELVAQVTVLAAPGTGLESQLSSAERDMAAIAKLSPAARFAFQDILIHTRQYMVTRQRPDMQSALNACFDLRQALRAAKAGSHLEPRIDRYVEIARMIPDVDVDIRGKLNDFTLQAKVVDPISANLKTLASNEVERARERIAITSRISTLIVIATAATGFGLVLLLALLINTTVTRRIVAMTGCARDMREGNLEARAACDAQDELGVLGASFNDMSGRMHELVSNLEDMVQQRTAELTVARDSLEQLVRELDDKNHALEILSVTDRLTGIANRRKMESALQAELLRAKRYGTSFSVIMLDVDHFKGVNDTYGHQAGDTVLVALGNILAHNARETDIPGRWGGEEFLILCPETGLEMAATLAERYRKEIERKEFMEVRHVTASFGVTESLPDDTLDTLLHRADEALYRAKSAGRNRVEDSHRRFQ
jgi:diguanylate cyclase (GGDEF)-like protein